MAARLPLQRRERKMNASRNLWTALLLGLAGALGGLGLVMIFMFPIGSWNNVSTENRTAAEKAEPAAVDGPPDASEGPEGASRPPEEKSDGTQEVSKERAGEIAVAHLGEGRVTWSGKEDDRGALWEIEVTRPGGTETDVLVDAQGNVVHTVRKGGGEAASEPDAGGAGERRQAPEPVAEPAPEPQTVDSKQAAEIAASHVGGTVDSVQREADGDYGAAWDVDVYSPEGEYTIYVSEFGEVVRVEGPFTD